MEKRNIPILRELANEKAMKNKILKRRHHRIDIHKEETLENCLVSLLFKKDKDILARTDRVKRAFNEANENLRRQTAT